MNPEKAQAVWNKTDGKCWYCGKELNNHQIGKMRSNRDNFVADHATPRCQGGSNDVENLLPACWSCNSSKAGRDVELYRIKVALKQMGAPYFTPTQLIWMRDAGFDFSSISLPIFWGEQQ